MSFKESYETLYEMTNARLADRALEKEEHALTELASKVTRDVLENEIEDMKISLNVGHVIDFIEPRLALQILIEEGLREDDEFNTNARDSIEMVGVLRLIDDEDMLIVLAYLKSDVAFVDMELANGVITEEELVVLREKMRNFGVMNTLFSMLH